MNQLNYLKQGLVGNSKLWTWGSVFWLTMLGWILMQLLLVLPIMLIIYFTNPELFGAFMEVSSSQSVVATKSQAFLTKVVQISTLLGMGAFITFLNSAENVRKISGYISAILIPLSITSIITHLAFFNNADPELNVMLTKMMGANPINLALFLLSFPATLIALYLGQKFIHRRSLTSLHTAFAKFRWGRALQAMLVMWGVLAVATLIAKALGAPVNYIFDSKRFWGFMIVSLLFIPLQSATEEIVFRGYFNQALGHYISNKWIVFTITSLAFMALHLSNPEASDGAEKGLLPIVMSGYFFFGFACCILVLIDDGLEGAIGLHAGNNTFAAIFVNYENSVLPTPSIWQTVPDPTKDAIGTIITLCVVVAILYALRRKGDASPSPVNN